MTGFAQGRSAGALLGAVVRGGQKPSEDAFVLPVAVAIGSDGRIAVADLGRRCVHLYLPAARRYLKLTGNKGQVIASPVGVAFGEALRLFVSDSTGKLFAFGPDGAFLFALDKAGTEPLQRPSGLAYNAARRLLYVVDTLAHRVHALEPDGALAFSFGARGDADGRFNFPTHAWSAASGELYVTDALNFRVQIFDADGRFLAAFGHHGDGWGDLAMPKGLAVDAKGVVYVVDGIFDNVQLFDRQGGFLLTVGARGTGFGEFWLPSGAFIGQDDELYVCDTYNRRVQVFRIAEGHAQPGS